MHAFHVIFRKYPCTSISLPGDSVPAVNAIDKLQDLVARSDEFIKRMHQIGAAPNNKKQLERLFSPGEAAEMVGRDRTTLARAEAELQVVRPARNPETNYRLGYTLEQIQIFRTHFGTLPWRDPATDRPMIVACQNFKGGVGKSTTCVNFSHYLALKGYRVLVIDTDSQATTTSFFGYVPDEELTGQDTILPYLFGEKETLDYAVRRTYWPNIDLVPACLALYDSEISVVVHLAQQTDPAKRREFFSELRFAIDSVSERYDVILIDSPPALGVIALSSLMAADALIVPTGAKMLDFTSTAQFFRMILNYIHQIDPGKTYQWINVLTTQFSRRASLQPQFVDTIRNIFGDSAFERVVHETTELQFSAAMFGTPYEAKKPNRKTLAMLDSVFEEIEIAIQRCWPSKAEQLSQRGIV